MVLSLMDNTYIGVLSCSNMDAGNNPYYFPDQDFYSLETIVNNLTAQPVNFHLEALQIGNVFQGSLPSPALTYQASSVALAPPLSEM